MKKLRFVSLVVLSLSVILWTAGRIFFPRTGKRCYHADRHGVAGVFQRPAKD